MTERNASMPSDGLSQDVGGVLRYRTRSGSDGVLALKLTL